MSMMPPEAPPAPPPAAPMEQPQMCRCPACGIEAPMEEFMSAGEGAEGQNMMQDAGAPPPPMEGPPPDADQAMAEQYAQGQPPARRGDPNKMAALLKGFGG